MKIKSGLVVFLLLLSCSFAFADKLEKGFERLNVYDYFNAKKYFEEALKKDPAGAAYGLSIIYSSDNNPFYNLDSARQYILISDSCYSLLKEKEKIAYRNFRVSDTYIQSQKDSICEKAFNSLSAFPTVEKFNYFIRKYTFCSQLEKAVELRSAVAYKTARAVNTSAAFKKFIETYPDAQEKEDATNHLEERIYEETTADKTISSYENFIALYPESPYRLQAEKMIFHLAVPHKTIDEYYLFTKNYSSNRNWEEAWREIFKLATKDYDEQVFENFKKRFPDYPFRDELESDYRLQHSFFLPFNKNNLWGYINENGEETIKAQYEETSLFSEGLAAVKKNGKYGYINKSGKEVIHFLYDDAEFFKNNSAVVSANGKSGLINRTGEELIPLLYDALSDPSENMCVAVQNDKSAYISKSGKKLTEFIFDFSGDFKDGFAIASSNDKFGLLNNACNFLIKPQYGELLFMSNGFLKAKQNDQWGIINLRDEVLVPFLYDAIGDFSENKVFAAKNKKCGFINSEGKILIPLNYPFNEDLINTANFKNGYVLIKGKPKSVLLDSTGAKISIPGYEDIGMPSEGLVPVKKNGKWGFADMNGKLKVFCIYDYVSSFENGFAKIKTANLLGSIDSTGKVAVPPFYEDIILKNNFFIARNNGRYGLLSNAGTIILPTEFDRIEFLSDKIASAYKGENLLYVNLQTEKIIWKEKE